MEAKGQSADRYERACRLQSFIERDAAIGQVRTAYRLS
jgi:hypothetical protein